MKNPYKIVCCLVLCSLFVSATPSLSKDHQTAETTLPKIEVLATRTQPKNTEATAITVITQEEIRNKNHFQVQDLLREQLGVSAVQLGGPGGAGSVFMRGANTASTLVMIDGVQANLNTSGGFNFSDLNLDNVERIEILRGVQSTLWGSDAVGGVINIVTKKGEGQAPEHFFGAEGGSYGTSKVRIGSSGDLGFLDYSVVASRTDSEGFSAVNEKRGATERDDYENTTVSTRIGKTFLGNGRIDFIGRYTQSFNDFDSSFLAMDSSDNSQEDEWYVAIPIEKQITDWWHARLNLNYGQNELNTRSAFPSFIVNRSYTADFQNNFRFNEYFSFVAGFEHQTLNGKNFSNGLEGENHSEGLYAQVNFQYEDRLFLNAGFRQTENSIYKDALNYKIEAAYKFNDYGTKIRGAVATGFRAPTFNELFFPFLGNPNLVPEETESFEVGLHQELWDGRVVIDTTYFDVDYDNLIIFRNLGGIFSAHQVDAATARGFETSGSFQVHDNVNIGVTHTYVETRDLTFNTQLARRPENIYTVNVRWTPVDWFDALFAVHTRGPAFSTDPGVNRVSGNSVGRLALAVRPWNWLEITGRVENLWDEEYEVAVPFGTPGVSGYVGFNLTY